MGPWLFAHPGYKILPEIPENLIAKPTLMWLYDNRTENAHNEKYTKLIYEEAFSDVKSAIRFHTKTFGKEVWKVES